MRVLKHTTAALCIASLFYVHTSVDAAETRTLQRAAAWASPYSFNELEENMRFVEALLDRRLNALAEEELAKLDDAALTDASAALQSRYAENAIRALMESAKLTTEADRAQVAEKLETLRSRVPDADAVSYELTYVRALYDLGALAAAAAQEDASEEATNYLTQAAAAARAAVERLDATEARPFLYWHIKATLADRADAQRFEKAEKRAAALAKSSQKKKDEYYFYALLLGVETAREQGDLKLAGERVSSTLDELNNAPNAPVEIAVGLVSEETKLLLAEGKNVDAIKTAVQDVDLLGAPLPEDQGRYADRLLDLFSERNYTRAKLFRTEAADAPDESDDAAISDMPTKKALLEAAKLSTSELRSNVWRALASLQTQALGDAIDDWNAIEASAQERYRNAELSAALTEYDRAAEAAEEAGQADDAYRLRSTAAAIVDKICRDKDAAAPSDKSEAQWNAEAKTRFLELAKERPENELSSSFYLLALERATKAEEDAMRAEYLTLFPEAPNRALFALDLARQRFTANDVQGAQAALDYIAPNDANFADALALERSIYEAGANDETSYVSTLDRALNKASFADATQADDIATLAQRLTACANALSAKTPTDADKALLAFIFEISLQNDARKSSELAEALEAVLDSWEKNDRGSLAQIGSFRLSLAVDTKTPEELTRLLGSLDDLDSGAVVDALDKILLFAETAQQSSKTRLAQFALDSLVKLGGKDARSNILKADALRMLGKSQDALNLYAAQYKKDAKNARAIRGIATLLAARSDAKTLEQSVKYWSDLADLYPAGTPEWWDAKERCVEVYCKVGKTEQAKKMLKTLWLTRSDPTDPGRKARWERVIAAAEKKAK